MKLTKSLFTKESKSILERCRSPPFDTKVIRKKFEHNILFLVPSSLLPKSMHEANFTERKVEQRTSSWISCVASHVLIPSYGLKLRFLVQYIRESPREFHKE